MPNSQPFQMPGETFTGSPRVAVIGARFVKPHSVMADGNWGVQPAGAGDAIAGVAATDAPVNNPQGVLVWSTPGMITEVTAGTALTAGQQVQSDASGQAIVLAAGVRAGLCMADTASGALAPIKL